MNLYSILAKNGLQVTLGDLGARIVDINLNGTSLVARYPALEDYHRDRCYLGATIGPIANRLVEGRLRIEEKAYQLPVNEGNNSLHGGTNSYDQQHWRVSEQSDSLIEFKLSIAELDNPLPGSIELTARYQVQGSQLQVDYSARTSQVNYLNMTNHVYLNLNSDKQSIQNHEFTLFADSFLLVDTQGIPTGESIDIYCPFNYSINSRCTHRVLDGSVDHHFDMAGENHEDRLNKLVEVRSSQSDIRATVSSNKTGFQFYTGQFLSDPLRPFDGFCIEPQFAPNAPNEDSFYSPYCSEERPYLHTILYQFG